MWYVEGCSLREQLKRKEVFGSEPVERRRPAMSESAASDRSAEMDPREALLQIVNGTMLSQCVYVAAKLGIADLLKDGPKSSDELAAATQVHAPSLYRILRSLAGFGIFAEDEERRFTLNPMAEPLRSDVPGSARGWTIMRGEEFLWQPWGQILPAVKTGEYAFGHVFGKDGWEYFAEHPEASAVFDQAMRSISALKFKAVAEAYDFSGVDTIVDVGGGNGGLCLMSSKARGRTSTPRACPIAAAALQLTCSKRYPQALTPISWQTSSKVATTTMR
jgi:hypothetical protein